MRNYFSVKAEGEPEQWSLLNHLIEIADDNFKYDLLFFGKLALGCLTL